MVSRLNKTIWVFYYIPSRYEDVFWEVFSTKENAEYWRKQINESSMFYVSEIGEYELK